MIVAAHHDGELSQAVNQFVAAHRRADGKTGVRRVGCEQHELSVAHELAHVSLTSRAFQTVRQRAERDAAGFERGLHGDAIRPARAAGNHGEFRRNGFCADVAGERRARFVNVARTNHRDAGALQQPDIARAEQHGRRLMFQSGAEVRWIMFIHASHRPEAALEMILEFDRELAGEFEQARDAFSFAPRQRKRLGKFIRAATVKRGGILQR